MKFQMSNKNMSDHHRTPEKVFDFIKNEYTIDLKKMFDPCPYHSKFDGLKINWKKRNYVNPPYSKMLQFVIKAYTELRFQRETYFLFPLSKTDKPYFHIILKQFELIYFPFRIEFVGDKNPSPQTHCLVIMK